MEFKSHTFGVKIAENNISVELLESLEELSKYQFLLSDKITNNYNGNTTYGINIQQLTTKEYIEFFGWKLIYLSFQGNWFGQTGYWELEDLNGKRKSISVTNHQWYHQNSKEMIKESIINAKLFAENNYSVDYTNFLSDMERNSPLLPTNNKLSLKDFTRLISMTKEYIENYQKISANISNKNELRNISLIDKLNKSLTNYIKKYYQYEIEMKSENNS